MPRCIQWFIVCVGIDFLLELSVFDGHDSLDTSGMQTCVAIALFRCIVSGPRWELHNHIHAVYDFDCVAA